MTPTEREQAAREWLDERGTDKPYTQVAKEWREYKWTAEDCARFGDEIVELLAAYGADCERRGMERAAQKFTSIISECDALLELARTLRPHQSIAWGETILQIKAIAKEENR